MVVYYHSYHKKGITFTVLHIQGAILDCIVGIGQDLYAAKVVN